MGETMVETARPEEKTEEEQSTIAKELMVKHPLQNRWSLWFFKNDKSKNWAANLRRITTFDSVEDFWSIYNHIQLASKLSLGCDYSLFKEGVQPMWEDDRNRMGGRWLVNMSKAQRNSDLDRVWLETLLCLIGEAFGEDSDQVCGAVVNIRAKGDKLAVWTQFADKSESVLHIGKMFKERLTLPAKFPIMYEKHMDTANKTGSQTKNKYQL
ncbi:eukaryotic translation initiation factor 4E-1A-like [Clytia hemisphaerica]|uniref:EIF-4F 25 kDa subunit n=1 Tax=Clytia hemisphaerica TaxID=252671 RepID=A0A7M5XJM6_9CNID|eukprot:TCONS_00008605-protein